MATISESTPSTTAVWHAVSGGKFRVRLDDPKAKPGSRFGNVLDDAGNVIGSAHDYIYAGRGYAVNTKAYGGYVSEDQVEYVR